MRTVLVRMELVGEPVKTPDGQTLHIVRFPWMPETPMAVGHDDIITNAMLCDCGFHRGRNRLTHDPD